MRYVVINELNHFDFHDASLEKISYHEGNMIWKVSSVNATTESSQNNFNEDMCIKEAEVIFQNFNIEKIVFSAYEVYDSNQILIESIESITAKPNEYDDILNRSLEPYCYIYSMEELIEIEEEKYLACFNIDGGAGDYDITLSFTASTIQWNEYAGKAWYEHEKWKNR